MGACSPIHEGPDGIRSRGGALVRFLLHGVPLTGIAPVSPPLQSGANLSQLQRRNGGKRRSRNAGPLRGPNRVATGACSLQDHFPRWHAASVLPRACLALEA